MAHAAPGSADWITAAPCCRASRARSRSTSALLAGTARRVGAHRLPAVPRRRRARGLVARRRRARSAAASNASVPALAGDRSAAERLAERRDRTIRRARGPGAARRSCRACCACFGALDARRRARRSPKAWHAVPRACAATPRAPPSAARPGRAPTSTPRPSCTTTAGWWPGCVGVMLTRLFAAAYGDGDRPGDAAAAARAARRWWARRSSSPTSCSTGRPTCGAAAATCRRRGSPSAGSRRATWWARRARAARVAGAPRARRARPLARVPDYLDLIPSRHVRYRLFCLWPALWALGLAAITRAATRSFPGASAGRGCRAPRSGAPRSARRWRAPPGALRACYAARARRPPQPQLLVTAGEAAGLCAPRAPRARAAGRTPTARRRAATSAETLVATGAPQRCAIRAAAAARRSAPCR